MEQDVITRCWPPCWPCAWDMSQHGLNAFYASCDQVLRAFTCHCQVDGLNSDRRFYLRSGRSGTPPETDGEIYRQQRGDRHVLMMHSTFKRVAEDADNWSLGCKSRAHSARTATFLKCDQEEAAHAAPLSTSST